MPRNTDEASPVDGHRRRRTYSTSSSPEPYRKRRRSREPQGTESRDSDSRIRERNKERRRHSESHDREEIERSRSPRRSFRQRYDQQEGHRSSRRNEDDEEHYFKDPRRTSPRADSSRVKRPGDETHTSVRDARPLASQQDAFKGETTALAKGPPPVEKQMPNFSATGRLAAESNTVKSTDGQAIVLKYHEPVEARKPPPKQAWRMYVFKGSEIVDTIELSERSCWLFGREAAVVDFLVEHPSCSKQHAVVQFRYSERRNEFGDKTGKVRPYLIDLESANGTSMNGEEVPAGRYLELRDKDVLKFGHSTREYVLQLPP